MKRIAGILTGISLAVLSFVVSAHAQSGPRMTADIPFEFTIGRISLPAGQYEFLNAGSNVFEIRGADRRSLFALSSAPIQANQLPEKSVLKFTTVEGRHVLVQIWNELAANGNEFPYGHTSVVSGQERNR